jgi:WD40 repeat protein
MAILRRAHLTKASGPLLALGGVLLALAVVLSGWAAPAPESTTAPDEKTPLLTLGGRAKDVGCVACSPDGRRVASTEYLGNELRVHDAATGREVFALTKIGAAAVAYSPDSKRPLLAVAGDKRLFDADTGKPVLTLELDRDYRKLAVAFSPDGKRLALGGEASKVYFPDSDEVRPDGTRRARYRDYGIVTLHDTNTGKQLRTITAGMGAAVSSLAFSPDGRRLATVVRVDRVKVWDVDTGKELLVLQGRTRDLGGVAFSPDGKLLASACMYPGKPTYPGEIVVWDAASGEELFVLPGHRNIIRGLAFSPDGRYLASCGSDGLVKVWDTKARKLVVNFVGHIGGVKGVAFSRDGKRLASGGGKVDGPGEVKIWDVAKYLERNTEKKK